MKSTLLIVTLSFLLGSCLGIYTLVEPKRTTIAESYSVDPQIPWSSIKNDKMETWTVDGPPLQALHFVDALQHEEELIEARDKEKLPKYRNDMTPLEIMEFVHDTLERSGYAKVETEGLRPHSFGSAQGFRFDLHYINPQGLAGRGLIAGAVINEELYLIVYLGVGHYYTNQETHVMRLLDSIEIQSTTENSDS